MKRLVVFYVVLVSFLTGCAHVMSEPGLALVDRSINYTDIRKNPETFAGKHVLVGGIIVGTRSSGDVMQLEVAQLELLSNGVPNDLLMSGGRFLVVSGELLDPLFYRPGALITIIGEIKGQAIQKLEGADYRYPLVSAKEIRVFPTTDGSFNRPVNPYQSQIGDKKFMLRPPGMLEGEVRHPVPR